MMERIFYCIKLKVFFLIIDYANMSVTMNDPKMTASCVALLAFLKELKVETSKALNKDDQTTGKD